MPLLLAAAEKTAASNRTPVRASMGGVHGVDATGGSVAEAASAGPSSRDRRADLDGNTSAVGVQNGSIISKYDELVDAATGKCAGVVVVVDEAVAKTGRQQKLQTSESARSAPNGDRDGDGDARRTSASSKSGPERRPSLIDSIISKFSNTAAAVPSQALLRPAAKRDANRIEISSKFQQSNSAGSIFGERFKRPDILERRSASARNDAAPESRDTIEAPASKVETSAPAAVGRTSNGSALAGRRAGAGAGVQAGGSTTNDAKAGDPSAAARSVAGGSNDTPRDAGQVMSERTSDDAIVETVGKQTPRVDVDETNEDAAKSRTSGGAVRKIVSTRATIGGPSVVESDASRAETKSRNGRVDSVDPNDRRGGRATVNVVGGASDGAVRRGTNERIERCEARVVERRDRSEATAARPSSDSRSDTYVGTTAELNVDATTVARVGADETKPKESPAEDAKVDDGVLRVARLADAVRTESDAAGRAQRSAGKVPTSRFRRPKALDETTPTTDDAADGIGSASRAANQTNIETCEAGEISARRRSADVGASEVVGVAAESVDRSTARTASGHDSAENLDVKAGPRASRAEHALKTRTLPTSDGVKKREGVLATVNGSTVGNATAGTVPTTAPTVEAVLETGTRSTSIGTKRTSDGGVGTNSNRGPPFDAKTEHETHCDTAEKFKTRADSTTVPSEREPSTIMIGRSAPLRNGTKANAERTGGRDGPIVDDERGGAGRSVKVSSSDGPKARTERLANDVANESTRNTDARIVGETTIDSDGAGATVARAPADGSKPEIVATSERSTSTGAASERAKVRSDGRSDVSRVGSSTEPKGAAGESRPRAKIVRRKASTEFKSTSGRIGGSATGDATDECGTSVVEPTTVPTSHSETNAEMKAAAAVEGGATPRVRNTCVDRTTEPNSSGSKLAENAVRPSNATPGERTVERDRRDVGRARPATAADFGSNATSAVKSVAGRPHEKDEDASDRRPAVKREPRAGETTARADRNNNADSCKLSVPDANGDPADGMKSKIKQTRPGRASAGATEGAARPKCPPGRTAARGNDVNNPLNVVIVARSNQCVRGRETSPPADASTGDRAADAVVDDGRRVDPTVRPRRDERATETEQRSSDAVVGHTQAGNGVEPSTAGRTFVVRSKISESLVRDSSAFAGKLDGVPSKTACAPRASPAASDRKVDLNAGDADAGPKIVRGGSDVVVRNERTDAVPETPVAVPHRADRSEISGVGERERAASIASDVRDGIDTDEKRGGVATPATEPKRTVEQERQRRSPSCSSVSSTDTITSNYESVASSSYDTAASSAHRLLPPLPRRAAVADDRCRRSASDSVGDAASRQERCARHDVPFFRKSAPDSFVRRGSPIPPTRPGGRVTTGKLVISRSPSPMSSRSSTGIGSMSRSVSPCSRASSLSYGGHSATDRSSTPRRTYPQMPARAGLDDLMCKEQSPVVFGANLSFVIGCKSQVRQSVKSTAAHLDSTTASNYLSTKISDFLKRTDHVMDEWKHSGHGGNDADDLPRSEQERIMTGRSRSAANIAIKGYTMFSRDRSRRGATASSEDGSRSRSSSMASDLFLNDGDTYSECDELSEMTADLAEEHSTATLATERLDAETSERLRLERELSEVQTKNKSLQQTSERLEMELLYARSDLNGLASDEDEDGEVDGGAFKQKYERTLRELEFTKRRLQQQHEDDLEQLVGLKKQLEKKLTDAYEEVEEQRQVVGQWKRKVQKHVSEMNDLRLLLEEQNSRNNLLEKKQRKFDSETQLVHDELRQERQARERVSREKEVILAEKYTVESSLADVRLELELKDERLRSLQQEIDDLTFGGKEDEVATLRKQKQDCERRLHEQEEELDDLAGQVQILEQARVRLEMSLEQQKKEAKRESQQREDELEEVRGNAQKKVKALEAQLENEHEERTLLLREKHSLERRLATIAEEGRTEKEGDEAQLQRLKRDLKRTKALLRDAQTMLERAKADNPGKAVIRQLRNQLDDLECARAAAVKSKQSLETELSELQSQLDEAHRQRSEAEDKANAATRERIDLRTQIEENEEELAEVLKKYRSAVQQLSMDQMALQEQMSLVAELEGERNGLKEQLAEMTSKLESRETMDDSSTNVQTKRMELRVKELESKLEFEQTTRGRLEVQIARLKETVDKLQTDVSHSRVREQTAQDTIRKVQRSLRELKDEHTASMARESESAQKRKELEKKFESAEAETAAAKSDLRLALQRIEDLQAAIQGELEDTTSDHSDSDHDSYSSDESIETFLANHKLSPVKTADRPSLQLDSGPRSVERNVRPNATPSPAKSSFA